MAKYIFCILFGIFLIWGCNLVPDKELQEFRTEDNKIKALKEFGCNRNTYNPYQEGDTPQFKAEKANWF